MRHCILLLCCALVTLAAKEAVDLGKPFPVRQLDGITYELTLSVGKGAKDPAPIKMGSDYQLVFQGSKLVLSGGELAKPWNLAVTCGQSGDMVKILATADVQNPKDKKLPAEKVTLEASLRDNNKVLTGTITFVHKGSDGKDVTVKANAEGKPPGPPAKKEEPKK